MKTKLFILALCVSLPGLLVSQDSTSRFQIEIGPELKLFTHFKTIHTFTAKFKLDFNTIEPYINLSVPLVGFGEADAYQSVVEPDRIIYVNNKRRNLPSYGIGVDISPRFKNSRPVFGFGVDVYHLGHYFEDENQEVVRNPGFGEPGIEMAGYLKTGFFINNLQPYFQFRIPFIDFNNEPYFTYGMVYNFQTNILKAKFLPNQEKNNPEIQNSKRFRVETGLEINIPLFGLRNGPVTTTYLQFMHRYSKKHHLGLLFTINDDLIFNETEEYGNDKEDINDIKNFTTTHETYNNELSKVNTTAIFLGRTKQRLYNSSISYGVGIASFHTTAFEFWNDMRPGVLGYLQYSQGIFSCNMRGNLPFGKYNFFVTANFGIGLNFIKRWQDEYEELDY
ncbi:MAG: hypothetical protein R2879_21270 [Saprospiraceae bacterium]